MSAHAGFEVAIGGGDESHVGVDDLLAADARELAVLEHVQQLGLQPQRHLADLVEEERALVGRLELAGLLAIGAGERALLVAEQLGLEQLARQGGAVHLQELLAGTRRRLVESARDDLLAGAALARRSTVVFVLATFEIRSRIGCILLLVQRAIRGSIIACSLHSVVSTAQLSTVCREMQRMCQGLTHTMITVITST